MGNSGGCNPDCGFYRSVGRLVDGSGAVNKGWKRKAGVILIFLNMAYASALIYWHVYKRKRDLQDQDGCLIEGNKMISWKLSEEKEMVLYYAKLLGDEETIKIIERDEIHSKKEASHVAEFFWRMMDKSNELQFKNDSVECEFLLEKVINTLMAYFRVYGYEAEWDAFADM